MRLIVLGDFHYSGMEQATEEMREKRDAAYGIMLDKFLETEGDYHISLGDLTHEGLPGELRHVFDQVGASPRAFIHVLGNHDAYSLPKSEILDLTGQQRFQSIETDEAVLIFLDTTKEMNRSDWGGELDAEQLEWLQDQLVRSGDKPALVFAHHPVYGTTSRSTLEKLSIDPGTDIKAVLSRKQGAGLYFCGHNHANSIVEQGGWHFVQTAACLDVPAVRIVDIEDGRISTELHLMEEASELGESSLASLIGFFNTRMKGFVPHGEAAGGSSDSALEVTFKDGKPLEA